MIIDTLVATMHQTNLDKYNQMKIATDAIFANQGTFDFYLEKNFGNKKAVMITTSTKGVGCNRNFALNYSSADICLLADDDLVYIDGYHEKIKQSFLDNKDADMIIFNIITQGRQTGRRINHKSKRVRLYNFLNYGAARIAFRRESIVKKNIWFSHLFGGGAKYGSGEDTLFLRQALKEGLKVYTCNQYICQTNQKSSTWFSGFNEKFFFDKGALFGALFPVIFPLFTCLYFPIKFKKRANLGYFEIIKLMNSGSKGFKEGFGYEEYKDNYNS